MQWKLRWAFLGLVAGLFASFPLAAQSTGSIVGQVSSASGEPLAGALVVLVGGRLQSYTGADGRFVLGAVPAGERNVRVEMLGHRTVTVTGVRVTSARPTELRIKLEAAPVPVRGVEVEAERVRLLEPEVSTSHQVMTGKELQELPIDRLDEALELTTGVSAGHFRGGRIGQETYLVDGLNVKNPLEASSKGAALEFSPTSLDELEIITGGLGAEYGSALSGAVSYATRRGNAERWDVRTSLRGDGFVPAGAGFTALSLSVGGPIRMLGLGTTLFVDGLAQGMIDADPRVGGLSCLTSADVAPELGARIDALRSNPQASRLYCPYAPSVLPHDAGDKLIGFLRLDRPLGGGVSLTATYLGNRLQRQLYTSELKYSAGSQLGQRTLGSLGTLALDWTRNRKDRTDHLVARVSAMRLDRYLGALDPLNERATFAGFGLAGFRFLGESFARSGPQAQLDAGTGVPGYAPEVGTLGSPFGPGGAGIFFTAGTPQLANWTRSDQVGADLQGEVYTSRAVTVRGGLSGKLFRVQSYERTAAAQLGSAFNYARFYPATLGGYGQVQWGAADDLNLQLGIRFDAFRPGLEFRPDRADFLAPTEQTTWKKAILPRFGASMPLPGSDNRTVVRVNFTRLAEPPDFQYFLDTTLGDSLRTSIRRQGNANLSFESGSAYEAAITHLIGTHVSVGLTAFRKNLDNLVSGDVRFASADPTFSLADYGTVSGVELAANARWPLAQIRGGYSLQKAVGVSSTALGDTVIGYTDVRTTYPLAFDQRHTIDLSLLAGRAAVKLGAGRTFVVRKLGFGVDNRSTVAVA